MELEFLLIVGFFFIFLGMIEPLLMVVGLVILFIGEPDLWDRMLERVNNDCVCEEAYEPLPD
jgi:hypothetical protein